MEERTQQLLEYGKILHQLAELAASPRGRRLCEELLPETEEIAVTEHLQETTDAVQILLQKSTPPLQGIHDVAPFLQRARSGSSMACGQLMKIAGLLRAVARVHSFTTEEEALNNGYAALMRALTPLPQLEKRLSSAIIGEEEIADSASPELGRIRHQIRKQQEQVRVILERLMRTHSKSLQEQLITQRGSRYVLPVKDSQRQAFPGIVHDTSGSGQTLFIEPLEVIEANNKIRELEAAEREEIERILERLSEETVAVADDILLNCDLLARIDFITAKARLSLQHKAHPPRINTEGQIHLLRARHPLLDPKKAVPISLDLGGSHQTLLITGPNTGGKTVALKTCGLLSLMAQSGLHIPASEHSSLCIFREIMADIGDEQSIEQSLSTFSSHMTRLIQMTAHAAPGCLILSDELGSGTDPLEGAALAKSVLEAWRERGALTLATTHYRELKLYALGTEGVENACVELDPETLRPTYRILMGAVGTSHAFSISRRLGLSDAIINRAQSYLSESDTRMEEILRELTQARQEAEIEQELAREARQEADRLKEEADSLVRDLKTRKREILDEARREAREQYAEGLQEADALLRELKKARELGLAGSAGWDDRRRRMGESLHTLEKEIGSDTLARLHEAVDDGELKLEVGETYFAPTLGLTGKLVSLPDSKGQCKLAAGTLQVNVAAATLQSADKKPKEEKGGLEDKSAFYRQKQGGRGKSGASSGAALPLELMLLGETTMDAIQHLDKYIDQVQCVGIHEIRIVHGKGTGALRKAVQQFLKRDKRVKEYRLAGYGEGDSGVTIATLK